MNKFDIYIDIEDKRWKQAVSDIEETVEMCKNAALKVVQKDVWFLSEPKDFTINLALSDDKNVRMLNAEFRDNDKPTNVLSFANIDDDFFDEILKNEEIIELGDVILAFETMKREAEFLNISFREHFCHLWVHGMLHILGFDHIKEDDRIVMEQKETEILQKLGFENPYSE